MAQGTKSYREHFADLRRDLIVCMSALVLGAACSYLFLQEQAVAFWFGPVKSLEVPLVYLTLTEAFMTKIKVSLLFGTVLAFPIIVWRIAAFLLPALTSREKKLLLFMVPLSAVLFAAGIYFAYVVMLPFVVKFFLEQAGGNIIPMISVGRYVSFMISLLLPFGVVFQLPLVAIILTQLGIADYKRLAAARKYAVLIIFMAAAVLTPPDVVSQVMMAVPILVLYEISTWLSLAVMVQTKRLQLREVPGYLRR